MIGGLRIKMKIKMEIMILGFDIGVGNTREGFS